MQSVLIQAPNKNYVSFLQQVSADNRLKAFTNSKSHAVEFFNQNGDKALKVGLPLNFSKPVNDFELEQYAVDFEIITQTVCIVLIQAGEAAMGLINNSELIKHKVIRKYMVRKKQGKMQLKHLKTKGKSRAGSRIRLAQSIRFFEDINQKLNEWFADLPVGLIVYSIGPTLLPFWNDSNIEKPFDLSDKRVRKANWTVRTPRQNELIKSISHIYSSRLSIFDPKLAKYINLKLEENKYIYR
ncbi:MAG: hypothetical protein ACPGLV_07030 [Bacteroidia bacterium]